MYNGREENSYKKTTIRIKNKEKHVIDKYFLLPGSYIKSNDLCESMLIDSHLFANTEAHPIYQPGINTINQNIYVGYLS